MRLYKVALCLIMLTTHRFVFSTYEDDAYKQYYRNQIKSIFDKNSNTDLMHTTSSKSYEIEQAQLDALALEYCKTHKNTYIAVIYPVGQGKEKEITELLQSCGPIIRTKKIYLKNDGPFYFIKHVYKGHHWIGDWDNDFGSVREVVRYRFPKQHQATRIFLFEAPNQKKVKKIKAQIRSIFSKGRKTMHTTDFHHETISLANVVFNKNSIHLLNNKKYKKLDNFEAQLHEYQEWQKNHHVDEECFCVTGNSVLAAYGIKDCDDFSFIHHGYDGIISSIYNKKIHCDTDKCMQDPTHKFNILFNPENHFYYDDVKFISLHASQEFNGMAMHENLIVHELLKTLSRQI
jgi:hypothetical protein